MGIIVHIDSELNPKKISILLYILIVSSILIFVRSICVSNKLISDYISYRNLIVRAIYFSEFMRLQNNLVHIIEEKVL